MSNYIPIEAVIDIYDQRRKWYAIDGFNGYELSNDGYVRSMKHFKKYPFGLLIRCKQTKTDTIFELTNSQNERKRLKLSDIRALVSNQPPGYPRGTIVTNTSSRNQKCTIRPKPSKIDNTTTFSPFAKYKEEYGI